MQDKKVIKFETSPPRFGSKHHCEQKPHRDQSEYGCRLVLAHKIPCCLLFQKASEALKVLFTAQFMAAVTIARRAQMWRWLGKGQQASVFQSFKRLVSFFAKILQQSF